MSGPRIDGRPEADSWPRFDVYQTHRTHTQCRRFGVAYGEAAAVTFKVTNISLTNTNAFALADMSPCRNSLVPCPGFVFPAGPSGDAPAECGLAVQAKWTSGTQATTTLVLTFSAQCSSAAGGVPCENPQVAAAKPSKAKPVTVN